MNLTKLPTNLSKLEQDGACNHLLNAIIPEISLPTQDDNMLKLNRSDTFRLVVFCYPMTGRPDQSLPKNWDMIPGARGCTSQNCSFRDNYDNLIKANALPIGVTTQSIIDIKEMTNRLIIPYDVLSDQQLLLASALNLPIFSINEKKFLKRVTLIIEKSVIKNFFYPIFSPNTHINEVLEWLNKN
jgi:peroxiredoxin|tara:strand:- start:923 stop:1477 length:555 start_codon:yes stop_codon:yes gene_type:complete